MVKVGGSLLVGEKGEPNVSFVRELVSSVAHLVKKGRKVVVVSSGAISLGEKEISPGCVALEVKTIPSKQALASIGQTKLMNLYSHFFKEYALQVGQVLLSPSDFSQRPTYLNARNTILTLLNLGVVPIVNENDTVAVEEIKFGDNDTLSALVATLIDANLLIILSDIEGLYTSDPKKDKKAKLLSSVTRIDTQIRRMAQGTSVEGRIGGMRTKIGAAKIATRSGITVIVGGGENFLEKLFAGKKVGTLFLPTQDRPQARKKWIAYGSRIKGRIVVDEGAREALMDKGKSLLPVGVKKVEGDFQGGDTVSLVDEEGKEFARGIAYYSMKELERIKGIHSEEIERKLGYKYYDEAVHRDNLAIL